MVTKIPINIRIIEDDGFHLFIKALINNKKANVLIDTGASKTVFDKNRIKNFVGKINFDLNDKLSIGLGTSSMKSHTTKIKIFKIGGIVIKDYETILLDLSHVNQSYGKLKLDLIDGVIGSDLLFSFRAIIDYDKKVLKLKSKENKLSSKRLRG